MSTKHYRLTEDIKRAVSDIISREVKDPRLGMLSITDVDLSRDLSLARIYFSVLGGEDEAQNTLEGLNNAKGFIRTELARRVRMRHTPDIKFLHDSSLERGARINAILRELGTSLPADSEGGEGDES
ncbi:MAG: 30S ribosome-binding factor RbfA [Firmicutes bacterium]|jgi:ribosome-binding factor A|nr:30S ribosome-binding factor RbfA [Bacillota bacterium]